VITIFDKTVRCRDTVFYNVMQEIGEGIQRTAYGGNDNTEWITLLMDFW